MYHPISSKSLNSKEFGKILCYPKYDELELRKRMEELNMLGVTGLVFEGNKEVNNIRILGKGCVGIVVLGYKKNNKIAIKIRRTDADRYDMLHEGKMLKRANQVMVGPKLYDLSENFILMEYLKGEFLPDWIMKNCIGNKVDFIKKSLKNLLFDCYKLDSQKIDHGELSNASKHVIIKNNGAPMILDFESSSNSRKVKNVQCMCQYLFIRKVFNCVNKILEINDINSIINALKIYKNNINEKNFENIMDVINLVN